MQTLRDLFQSDATKSIPIRPSRSHALVVIDSRGVRMLDHPVAGVRRSTLMVQGGHGDLVRNKPRVIAERLLTLPDVLPEEQRGHDYAEVPLVQPDQLESDDYTTWSIIPRLLLVDQIGASRAQFTITSPVASDVDTFELTPPRWWQLVRALVSLDSWMTRLSREMDAAAAEARRAALAPVA
ncbi:hypothetical protein SAMN04489732_12978 [Amycolatopsis saalfeldensis]|uniref:Uncharacterized protein n=1 Tax=Amycolatopsis saalfeldensis TaxID=394193 RepID=A0A1H8YNI8_9PSEU|nr:hypothetical protein SAMN04489732_12978 [Amycolatopsis saalfeldensis]